MRLNPSLSCFTWLDTPSKTFGTFIEIFFVGLPAATPPQLLASSFRSYLNRFATRERTGLRSLPSRVGLRLKLHSLEKFVSFCAVVLVARLNCLFWVRCRLLTDALMFLAEIFGGSNWLLSTCGAITNDDFNLVRSLTSERAVWAPADFVSLSREFIPRVLATIVSNCWECVTN